MMRAGQTRAPTACPLGLRCRLWAVALALGAVIFCAARPCRADPEETNPDAAAQDPDYAAGKKALERKDWREAAQRFSKATLRDPDNADLQNYLGYSYRHLRQFDLAFKHYKRALVLNPRHRGAHEYIGEAYLMTGDLAGARRHLEELRKICLLPCEEFADLEREIATYVKKSSARPTR